MVAASKLRRAQERVVAARPFAQRMLRVLNELVSRVDQDDASAAARRRAGPEPSRCSSSSRPTADCAAASTRTSSRRAGQFIVNEAQGRDRAWSRRTQGPRLLPAPRLRRALRGRSESASGSRSRTPRRLRMRRSRISPRAERRQRVPCLQRVQIGDVAARRRRAAAADSRALEGEGGRSRTDADGVSLRAVAGGDFRAPAAAARAGAGVSRAARIERGVLRRADDGDGCGHAQFGGHDREPDALHEQGAAGGDHARIIEVVSGAQAT